MHPNPPTPPTPTPPHPPRGFPRGVGVVLPFLPLMVSFSGYPLPWAPIAYWAITIGTNFGSYFPIVNTPTRLILLGGLEVGQNTLLRFYVGHVVFLLVEPAGEVTRGEGRRSQGRTGGRSKRRARGRCGRFPRRRPWWLVRGTG